MNKKKEQAKKTNTSVEAEKADSAIATADRPEVLEPFSRFGDWFEEFPAHFVRRFPDLFGKSMLDVEPIRVEQFTDNGDTVIRAEIPGVDSDDDIDISVVGNQLSISAKREQREESKSDKGFRSEFHYGSFRRTLILPPGADADDVEARYEDGILEVRVPVDVELGGTTKVAIKRKTD